MICLYLTLILSSSAWSQDYKFFKTSEEAYSHLSSSEQDPGEEQFVISSHDDPKYELANELVQKVAQAHASLNPSLKQLPIPKIVLIESPRDYGSAGGQDEDGSYPFLITLSKNILEDRELTVGIIAHELAHLYLKHGEEDEENSKRWSMVDDQECESPFPENQMPKLKVWLESFRSIGLGKDEGFEHLPSPRKIELGYSSSLNALVSEASRISILECQKVKELHANWFKATEDSYDAASMSYEISSSQRQVLSTKSLMLSDALRNCFEGQPKIPFLELLSKGSGFSVSKLEEVANEMDFDETLRLLEEQDAYTKAPSMIDGLRAVVKINQDRMSKFETVINPKRLRFYSNEDEADELAVKILHHLNIPLSSYNKFLTQGETCSSSPSYGTLQDPHHSGCWRVVRNNRILNSLQKNLNSSN